MGKVFFFALGVGATVFVVVKGRELARKATPAHLQEQVNRRAQGLAEQAGGFLATLRTSMDERERELRHELGMDERTA